jgi:hypothetical protein
MSHNEEENNAENKICDLFDLYQISLVLLNKSTQEEKNNLEAHCELCSVCLRVYLESSEIINNAKTMANSLTIKDLVDYKSLLIFFHSPFWQIKKNELIEIVLKEVKKNHLILGENEERENETMPSVSTIDAIDRPVSLLNSLTSNKYFYQVLVSLTAVILIFFIFTGIFLIKTKNLRTPDLANQASIAKLSISELNLYQQLDLTIDNLLKTSKQIYLTQSEIIANNILSQNTDNYGIDLVNYYSNLDKSKYDQFLLIRNKITTLYDSVYTSDQLTYAKELTELENQLSSVNNLIDLNRVKLLRIRYYALNSNSNYLPIIKEIEAYAKLRNYKYFSLYCLMWKAKIATPDSAIKDLETVKDTAKLLKINDIEISTTVSLVGWLELKERNFDALSIGTELLRDPRIKDRQKTNLLLILATLYYKENQIEQSRTLLNQALSVSTNNNYLYNAGLTCLLLGLTFAKENKIKEAQLNYLNAISFAQRIGDLSAEAEIVHRSLAYQAKIAKSENKFILAKDLYVQALKEYSSKVPNQNHYMVSELNEKIAEIYLAVKDQPKSQQYTATANYYQQLAVDNKEQPISKVYAY